MIFFRLALFTSFFSIFSLFAQHAYVVNNFDNNVSVIDVTTQMVVTTIMVGTSPTAVAISPDGTRAIVTNRNSNNITFIDSTTHTVINTIAVGSGPEGVAFSPDGTKAYVVNGGGAPFSISVINPAGLGSVSSTILGLGNDPLNVAFTPDGTLALVTNNSSNFLTRIDATTDMLLPSIAGVANGRAIAISPDGTTAYVTLGAGVRIVDIPSATAGGLIPMGSPTQGIAFTPNGLFAYATTNPINVIDATTDTVSSMFAAGMGPRGIAISSDGTLAYITNFNSDDVSIVDLASNTVIATFSVGNGPWGVAFTPFPSPVSSLTGTCCKERFLTQFDYVNIIAWPAQAGAVSYKIYRDAALTVLAGETTDTTFEDHNRSRNEIATYYVVSVDAMGAETQLGELTLNCSR